MYGIFIYKLSTYYKPTLFRADVREIAHGLIIRTIRYNDTLTVYVLYIPTCIRLIVHFLQVTGNTLYNMIRLNEVPTDKEDRPLEPAPKIVKTVVSWFIYCIAT